MRPYRAQGSSILAGDPEGAGTIWREPRWLFAYVDVSYYVYLLESKKTGRFYIGMAADPEKRLHYNNTADSRWTVRYRPRRLVFKYQVAASGNPPPELRSCAQSPGQDPASNFVE
jgi:hypothetical protein